MTQFKSDLRMSAGIVSVSVVVLVIGLWLSKRSTFGEAG